MPQKLKCELCFNKRKIFCRLRFGKLWRTCCRRCYKIYVKLSDEYQFIK